MNGAAPPSRAAQRAIVALMASLTACAPSPGVESLRAPAATSPAPSAPQTPSSTAGPAATGATAAGVPTTGAAAPSAEQRAAAAPFPPADVTPPSARSAADGDGRWQPLGAARSSDGRHLLYSTVLHPHETSRFISLTVVAVDLGRTRLGFLPGVDDVGKQSVPFVPGLVPADEQERLVAVFNGGFMPQHGRWGMQVGGVTLLSPRDPGCTIALSKSGGLQVRSWPALAESAAELAFLRQTPPCLLEQGEVHPDLLAGRDRAWAGRTPGIVTRRRSAIGLDASGQILLYAIGVEATPKLLALGLRAAGAAFAAQLDINWNWTRFLLFGKTADGKLGVTSTLAEVEHAPRDYVGIASKRDFFYLTTRE